MTKEAIEYLDTLSDEELKEIWEDMEADYWIEEYKANPPID